ncbi:MAG: flavodoxin family protein [Syntrophobacteraceae bacterium]
MKRILAIYGSPRKKGTTSLLLASAVRGAIEAGAEVESVFLRDLKMSPCLEIYVCKDTGRCAINDDFQALHDKLLACDALMIASPIFFYTVSAHTKIFMDRCQALWAKKYIIDKAPFGLRQPARKALFLSAGATSGSKLFDGVLLTMKYFLDTLDMELWKSLLFRGIEGPGDFDANAACLEEAYLAGGEFARTI